MLVILGNLIERMYFPDVSHGEKSALFPSLKQLYFTGSCIAEVSRTRTLIISAEISAKRAHVVYVYG